ncbi:formylglycine-generating enzyme family protein [Treponema sp. R80B11-R83G3]
MREIKAKKMSVFDAMKKIAIVAVFLLVVMDAFAQSKGKKASDDGQISALGAIGGLKTSFTGPYYTGDGGKNIRIAVLAPEIQGDVPTYLPVYIQGLLNKNFTKFSAMVIIDRQNLNKIINEQDIGTNGRFSDKDYISIGKLTNAQYYLFGTIQKISGERYSLQLSVSDSGTGVSKARFMKDGFLAQIEGSGSLINEATADLLAQLGITLNDAGTLALLAGNSATVKAEAGLARGITAQAAGSQIEALFNFSQSIAFDPSQMEALARLNTLSSAISGGTLSQRIVNDIQARDRWLEAFKETTRFFNDHPPFEIIFDPNLVQEGVTDYVKRTANLAMRIALKPSEAGFNALNALLEGLEKTGKRKDWGFSGWPFLDINPKTPGTVVFAGKKSFSYKVDVTLLNEENKILGKGSITLNTKDLNFTSGDGKVFSPSGDMGMIRFPNVKAADLTSTLTIVIVAVNGIPSQKLNASGYMRIDAGDLGEQYGNISGNIGTDAGYLGFVKINGGTFTMGSPANESGRDINEVQHQVTVSSFYMGKYEVTVGEFKRFVNATGYRTEAEKDGGGYVWNGSQWEKKADANWKNPYFSQGDNHPVVMVSWNDAIQYCNWLSMQEKLTPAYTVNGNNVTWNKNANGYRLPTEAEWEYACRAGTTTAYNRGAVINAIGWHSANSGSKTHPVGQKLANAWGLYDMHGNIWEWCWDWYGDYTSGSQTDPLGVSSGTYRGLRGGSWYNSAEYLRSASWNYYYPHYRYSNLGFRLVRP